MRRMTERQAWAVIAETFAAAPCRTSRDGAAVYDVPRRFVLRSLPTGAVGMCGVLTLLELSGRISAPRFQRMRTRIARAADRALRAGSSVGAFLYPLDTDGAAARVRYAKRQIARLDRARAHA